MQAFFRRVKAGQAPGYPRFKGVGWFDTVQWPKDGDGCSWDSTPDSGQIRVYLQGVGHVRVHRHRKVEGRVKTVSVKREGRRWFVILACDEVPAQPFAPTGSSVGIDVGVVSFLTTSDGVQIPNPHHLKRSQDRLTAAQQALTRRQRGSNRRGKARAQVAALHAKVRRQRLDHAHKTALWLVRVYDVIAHEQLNIVGMTKAPAPKPDGDGGYAPNGAAAKAGLSRSILDAGWGMFFAILAAKAEKAGRLVIAVNAANTSRTCPECGHVAKENRVTQADFACVRCAYSGHADLVGARNVLHRAGLVLQAAQAS
jgi:putative transposase